MENRYDRQSFLGKDSERIFATVRVGVFGLGGGGSHVVQQLAHLGIKNFTICDPDKVEDTNLNRLVGATRADAENATPKVEIAKRMIEGLRADAQVTPLQARWQDHAQSLVKCDVIIGCVDSFLGRSEIEVFSRRYLIPYVDIGMDVFQVGEEPPRMVGQVILSMPGSPCLRCLNLITDKNLAEEGMKYGDAGGRPQVIWANGVLASAAVGIVVDLLTDWTRSVKGVTYLSYDGNTNTLQSHVRLKYFDNSPCPHYDALAVGDPIFVMV